MSTYNVLLYQQGGTLYLDEPLPDQPSSCTITIEALDSRTLEQIGGTFVDVLDEAADVDDLVLTLPAKAAPWRTISPTDTAGTIGDMTAYGRRFLLNRGGRKMWVRVSEFDTDGTDVTEIRFDEGIDFALKTGDALKGVRCSYDVDWGDVSSTFVGRVKATWKVTISGTVHTIVKIYDVVKQVLYCPATWSDLLRMRPDADNELSRTLNKEGLIQQAWEDIVRDLDNMGIRHNLIIPDGSTVLRDATVIQCLINLTQYQGLSTPEGYIGQTDDYTDRLESKKQAILGKFALPVDLNQDGQLSEKEQFGTKRQTWFRRPNRHRSRD